MQRDLRLSTADATLCTSSSIDFLGLRCLAFAPLDSPCSLTYCYVTLDIVVIFDVGLERTVRKHLTLEESASVALHSSS